MRPSTAGTLGCGADVPAAQGEPLTAVTRFQPEQENADVRETEKIVEVIKGATECHLANLVLTIKKLVSTSLHNVESEVRKVVKHELSEALQDFKDSSQEELRGFLRTEMHDWQSDNFSEDRFTVKRSANKQVGPSSMSVDRVYVAPPAHIRTSFNLGAANWQEATCRSVIAHNWASPRTSPQPPSANVVVAPHHHKEPIMTVSKSPSLAKTITPQELPVAWAAETLKSRSKDFGLHTDMSNETSDEAYSKLQRAKSEERSLKRGRTGLLSARRSRNSRQAEMQARIDSAQQMSYWQFRQQYTAFGQTPPFFATLSWFVKWDYFNYGMGIILLGNAAMMGVQADYFAKTADTNIPIPFRFSDAFFCVAFTIETLLRLVAFGPKEFCIGEACKWNWFDTLIVTLQLCDEIVKLVFWGKPVQQALNNIAFVRMLRLCKLMRLVRMVRLIPELKSMVYLIFASIGSFFWSMFLIFIMMYVFAIYYTEMVTDLVADTELSDDSRAALKESWGTMPHSILSLWMAITGGDDWRNFLDILRDDSVYIMHVFCFVIYIAFGTLVMLNLVTGVFVEGAQRIIKEDKDNELLALAAKMFQESDPGCQEITAEDFDDRLKSGAMDEYIEAIGINTLEAEHLFESLDRDRSGQISLREFVSGCLRLRSAARSVDISEVGFRMRDNFIVIEQLIRDLQSSLYEHMKACDHSFKEISKGVGITIAADLSRNLPTPRNDVVIRHSEQHTPRAVLEAAFARPTPLPSNLPGELPAPEETEEELV